MCVCLSFFPSHYSSFICFGGNNLRSQNVKLEHALGMFILLPIFLSKIYKLVIFDLVCGDV